MDINRFIQELIEEDTTRTRSSGGSNSVNAQIAGNSSIDSNSTPRSDRSVASYNPRGRGRDPPRSVSSNNPRGPPSDSSVAANNPGVEGSGPSSFVAGSNNSGGGGSICSNNPGLSALSDSSVGSNSPESGDQGHPPSSVASNYRGGASSGIVCVSSNTSLSGNSLLFADLISWHPRIDPILPDPLGLILAGTSRDFPCGLISPEPRAAATSIVSLEGPEIKGRFSSFSFGPAFLRRNVNHVSLRNVLPYESVIIIRDLFFPFFWGGDFMIHSYFS